MNVCLRYIIWLLLVVGICTTTHLIAEDVVNTKNIELTKTASLSLEQQVSVLQDLFSHQLIGTETLSQVIPTDWLTEGFKRRQHAFRPRPKFN